MAKRKCMLLTICSICGIILSHLYCLLSFAGKSFVSNADSAAYQLQGLKSQNQALILLLSKMGKATQVSRQEFISRQGAGRTFCQELIWQIWGWWRPACSSAFINWILLWGLYIKSNSLTKPPLPPHQQSSSDVICGQPLSGRIGSDIAMKEIVSSEEVSAAQEMGDRLFRQRKPTLTRLVLMMMILQWQGQFIHCNQLCFDVLNFRLH